MTPWLGFIGAAWTLLTRRQKLAAFGCLIFFIFSSLLELAALSSAIPFVLSLMDPLYLSQNIYIAELSRLLGSPAPGTLLIIMAVLVSIATLVGALFNVAALTIIELFGVRVTAYLSERMVRQTLLAPYRWFMDKQAPVIAQGFIADPTSVGLVLAPPLMEIIYSSLILLFAAIIIIVVLPFPAMILLLVIAGILVSIVLLTHGGTLRNAERQRLSMMEANNLGIQAIAGIKDLKIKGRELYFVRAHNQTIVEAAMARLRLNLLNRTLPSIVSIVGQVGLVTIAVVMALQGLTPSELASQLTMLVLVLGRTLPAATRLSSSANKLATAKPHVQAIINLERELSGTEPSGGHRLQDVPEEWRILRLDGVGFAYGAGDRAALRDITLEIRRGGYYGIVGRSGAGKSTLVDLLLGLLPPTAGKVAIDGTPLDEFRQRSWFEKIGYVPQSPFIASDTLRRNVAFGLADDKIADADVWEALELAGLADVCRDLPDGLDTLMGDNGLRLSGGQRQRVAIARAFYDKPDVLMLDEATSALDVPTEREIQATIRNLAGRTTVIAIAHRLSTVEGCDQIFVLDHGQLIERGKFSELLISSRLFADLANH